MTYSRSNNDRFDPSISRFYKEQEFACKEASDSSIIPQGDLTRFAIEAKIRQDYGIKTREELYRDGQIIGTRANEALEMFKSVIDDYSLTKHQDEQKRKLSGLNTVLSEFASLKRKRSRKVTLISSVQWMAFTTLGRSVFCTALMLFAAFVINQKTNDSYQPKGTGAGASLNQSVGVNPVTPNPRAAN